jgi:cbb3-type cytochrome oxidase maturation protein
MNPRPQLRPVIPPESTPGPRARRFLWAFSIVLVLVAGSAFIFKLIEFFTIATTSGPEALGSFLIPVLNYLLVAGGFFCLFLWAYASGQFRDLEAAKYRMLELQEQFDRLDGLLSPNGPETSRPAELR